MPKDKGLGERKDFADWVIEKVYVAQQGSCKNCGRSLEKGFVRSFVKDHKDGDRSNVSIDNLRLMCSDCNRDVQGSDVGQKWRAHKDQEKKVLDAMNKLLDSVLGEESKIGGPIIERLEAVMLDSLKVSRRMNEIDKDIEYPPASIRLGVKIIESEKLAESYLDGFKAGIKTTAESFAKKD